MPRDVSSGREFPDVCLGSLADITARSRHVRFPPKADIRQRELACPLCAKSRHGDWFEASRPAGSGAQ